MNDEQYLIERVGKDNPFKVPENYFETLAERTMAAIPERKTQHKTIWRYAAAACFVAVIGTTALFYGHNGTETEQPIAMTDTTIDQLADYVMVDNYDIYAYLSDDNQ